MLWQIWPKRKHLAPIPKINFKCLPNNLTVKPTYFSTGTCPSTQVGYPTLLAGQQFKFSNSNNHWLDGAPCRHGNGHRVLGGVYLICSSSPVKSAANLWNRWKSQVVNSASCAGTEPTKLTAIRDTMDTVLCKEHKLFSRLIKIKKRYR